ncbi:hypothetical protein UlMin_030490 [Ulmus minor]
MDTVISEEQSVFLPGHLISDNAIIGFECLHALKRKRSKKKGFLALKLDMAKAYDRVEWSFIRGVMNKLGFSEGWINKVMACVTSIYYSLLINGEKVGQLQGMQCGNFGPTISHLFFADNSLLFVEATPASCFTIKEVLSIYEAASGQLVNYSKSAVCFGAHWKIGDGKDTYIYHDKWLPRDGCFKISSPRVLENFAKVSDIIIALACLGWARQHLSDFQQSHSQTNHRPIKTAPKAWEAPALGTIKVNTDATWCSRKKKVWTRDCHS